MDPLIPDTDTGSAHFCQFRRPKQSLLGSSRWWLVNFLTVFLERWGPRN